MSTHTPGPWEIRGDLLKQCGPKGTYLARIEESAGLGNAADANARLIAAAPELLAALKEVLRCSALPDHWAAPVRAAIAKAEGVS